MVKSLDTYQRDFIGTLVSVDNVELAFSVPGTIQSVDVVDGSVVRKGQVLATLDTEEYHLKVVAERENYLTAKSALERNERLLKRQAVSVQDYQISRAKYEAAYARFKYAESQLRKTNLVAPFTGSIQRVYAYDYQEVQAGVAVCRLINPSKLEVRFTLPQGDIRLVDMPENFFIEFEQPRGVEYSARIKEVVDASVDGAGIPVTLSITDQRFSPQRLNIKAGFACTVRVDIANNPTDEKYMTVPLSSVFVSATTNQEMVWVYNPQTSQLHAKMVKTNGLIGGQDVIISEGLQTGEQVVVAGVYQVTEGQRVKPIN